jgi:hypothetical protein
MFTMACIFFGYGSFPSLETIKPNIILENINEECALQQKGGYCDPNIITNNKKISFRKPNLFLIYHMNIMNMYKFVFYTFV